MDEKTTAQNIDDQNEALDVPAFDEEDEVFDMEMANNLAAEMFEKQQLEEMNQFKEVDGFAAKQAASAVKHSPERVL